VSPLMAIRCLRTVEGHRSCFRRENTGSQGQGRHLLDVVWFVFVVIVMTWLTGWTV